MRPLRAENVPPLGNRSAHACSLIGLKWLLFFASWDLRAVSCVTFVSDLFAVSAFFEPAEVSYATERQGYDRYRRVLEGGGNLPPGYGRHGIGVFRSSSSI